MGTVLPFATVCVHSCWSAVRTSAVPRPWWNPYRLSGRRWWRSRKEASRYFTMASIIYVNIPLATHTQTQVQVGKRLVYGSEGGVTGLVGSFRTGSITQGWRPLESVRCGQRGPIGQLRSRRGPSRLHCFQSHGNAFSIWVQYKTIAYIGRDGGKKETSAQSYKQRGGLRQRGSQLKVSEG